MYFIAALLIIAPVALVSTLPETLVDYRLALQTTTTTKDCTTPGLFCESCTSLVSCTEELTTKTWTKKAVQTCSSPNKCLNVNMENTGAACVSDYDYICDHVTDLAFPCTAAGIFPDPFYCNKFVMCVEISGKLQPYHSTCEDGYGYDYKTDLCSRKLDNGVCEEGVYPVPICKRAGDASGLTGKPPMYYQCEQYGTNKVLYPVLYLCPHGESYDQYTCAGAGNGETTPTF